MKKLLLIVGLALLLAPQAHALTSGTTYTITLSKVNSNGTTTDVTSATAVADSNGKISFTFSSVPTKVDANFLVTTIKDNTGTVVRRSLAPAPAAGGTNNLGANSLSSAQSDAILQIMAAAGTDDPIAAAFAFIITRQGGLSSSDITNIAGCGQAAILGSSGFVGFLQNNGVTSAQLTTFRQKLISNPGRRALPDFASKFKDAVEDSITSGSAAASQDTAQAGGFMGDIFTDAADSSSIDLSLLVAAFKQTGAAADSNSSCAAVSSTVQSGIGQSMKNFFTRISTSRIKREYISALNILSASGSQVTRFLSGVSTMVDCMQTQEANYGKYFDDPNKNPMTDTIKGQMDSGFQTCFTSFQTAIACTDAEVSTLRTNMANYIGGGLGAANLAAAGFGTFRDPNGTSSNWPIPQCVLYQWVIDNVGKSALTYTRDTLAIPTGMTWLGARTDFSSIGGIPISASLQSLMGLEEDLRIAEMTKFALFMRGGPPTHAQEQAQELAFDQRLIARQNALGGVTADQKKAIVRLTIQPNIH